MDYLTSQVNVLKEHIESKEIDINHPIIQEQKEGIIDNIYQMHLHMGVDVDRSKIGAIVDKVFAEQLGVE
ncbi:MAG: hypothetical protein MJZ30_08125 [Paludibacteraceae bacterium]|nr:hypothetical protein [Paludibacteraceae bacterium]